MAGKKGIRFERELIHKFWENGFAALRSAGSGAARYPMPDIVAGNGEKFIAIEVKKRDRLPVYLTEREVKELIMFANLFGAEPCVAVKITNQNWKFFKMSQLEKTEKSYKIDDEIFESGIELKEILEGLE
ncbi:MAG TPA: Holliday junction resolvase [Archaeoglobaceae archaeon]|nr:Holliday junction resolvase [Archaeoglobaceae archaeon]